jgi:hypothetical protein
MCAAAARPTITPNSAPMPAAIGNAANTGTAGSTLPATRMLVV